MGGDGITSICAWCGELMHDAGPTAPVSHGICPVCFSREAPVPGHDAFLAGTIAGLSREFHPHNAAEAREP